MTDNNDNNDNGGKRPQQPDLSSLPRSVLLLVQAIQDHCAQQSDEDVPYYLVIALDERDISPGADTARCSIVGNAIPPLAFRLAYSAVCQLNGVINAARRLN